MSRGVNPAVADWYGAIVRYFSAHGPTELGIVANNETFPRQSTVLMFCVQYSLTMRLLFVAATPTSEEVKEELVERRRRRLLEKLG